MPHKIVVIGGGPAGLNFVQTVAKNLSGSDSQIILIERREYYFHSFGSLRGMVDTDYIPKLFIPYDNAFRGLKNVEIKFGSVENIQYGERIVHFTSRDNSPVLQTIGYDSLVIATGSSYPDPIKTVKYDRSSAEETYKGIAQNIGNAERLLVIGGGAVGIEMAGEIKAFYPQKKVMLIDSHSELLSNQNVPKLRLAAKKALLNHGVELFLGERTVERLTSHSFETKILSTEKGLKIESDAQLVCVGMTPNVSIMKDPDCLDRGAIKVNDSMQVDHQDYENVFVLGDASNHPTPKMGYWGMMQGKHLGKTLSANIRSGKKLLAFKPPSTETLILPLGPSAGVSQLPLFGGLVVGNFFTKNVKGKDLMAGMSWKNLNAKIPK